MIQCDLYLGRMPSGQFKTTWKPIYIRDVFSKMFEISVVTSR